MQPEQQNMRGPEPSLAETFNAKCQAFRTTLFPTPPSAPKPIWDGYREREWDWPLLSKIELANACSAKIKGKTPGPDSITQEIIKNAYKAEPEAFYRLFSTLFDLGHHPKCWKQATGIILKKPGKPDYSVPKAYRVISLLNCLGKVNERIFAQRLGFLAETTNLLDPTQIGGRLKKSAIDAALLLTNEIEVNKKGGLITSTLFLDIKGAFDHVAKNQLLERLKALLLPIPLIAWIASFLSDRTLRLAFDGQTEAFSAIKTGIPQGSPISPILFLIYIRDLFGFSPIKFLSYIDDISMTKASTSIRKNVKILEREAKSLYELASLKGVQFDLAKTDLIHFGITKKTSLTLPNKEKIEPKKTVKWLGVYFDQKLNFKEHVNIRIAQAKGAFYRLNRLANTEKGLSPFALRQLYLAYITSVADYGSPIW
jgi:hypothetical protein